MLIRYHTIYLIDLNWKNNYIPIVTNVTQPTLTMDCTKLTRVIRIDLSDDDLINI